MLKNDTGSLSPPPWRGVGGGFIIYPLLILFILSKVTHAHSLKNPLSYKVCQNQSISQLHLTPIFLASESTIFNSFSSS